MEDPNKGSKLILLCMTQIYSIDERKNQSTYLKGQLDSSSSSFLSYNSCSYIYFIFHFPHLTLKDARGGGDSARRSGDRLPFRTRP